MHEAAMPLLGFDPMPRDAFAKRFDPLLENGCFFVFEMEGQVQGFYQVQRHLGRAAHLAYLGTLAVATDVQGLGFAGAMMEDALTRLRSASASSMRGPGEQPTSVPATTPMWSN